MFSAKTSGTEWRGPTHRTTCPSCGGRSLCLDDGNGERTTTAPLQEVRGALVAPSDEAVPAETSTLADDSASELGEETPGDDGCSTTATYDCDGGRATTASSPDGERATARREPGPAGKES